MRSRFRYCFVFEAEQEPVKVKACFSKEEVAKILEENFKGDFLEALNMVEEELKLEVRRNV